MNKKLVLALGLSLCSFSSLQAASFMKSMKHPRLAHKAVKTTGDYTDFSGVWTSKNCMGAEVTLDIEHDNRYFRINGDELTIGNMSTKSNSGEHNSFDLTAGSEIESIEWNSDKTQLMFRGVSIDKRFDIQSEPGLEVDTAMYMDVDNVLLALDKDVLTIKFNTATYKDMQKIDSAHPTCTFTKEAPQE